MDVGKIRIALLTCFLVAFAVTVIGCLACKYNVDVSCPNPDFPYRYTEKGVERPDINWCLPVSRNNNSRIRATEVARECDVLDDWVIAVLVTFLGSVWTAAWTFIERL